MLFGIFLSFFVNILALASPLFMMQVLDRVLGSRSLDTLTMLFVVTIGAVVLYGILEFIRGRTYHILGNNVAEVLSMPVMRSAVRAAAHGRNASVTQAMRDVVDMRAFVAGPSLGILFDLLWSPIFAVILWMLHPTYLLIGLGAAVMLVGVNAIGNLITKPALDAAASRAGEIYREMGQSSSRAEALEAMGMVVPLARKWRGEHAKLTADFDRAEQLGKVFSSTTRTLRIGVQVFVLATGAYLVINREVSVGTIIASSIITGRLLQPFEQLVESWRQWIFARRAYGRLVALLAGNKEAERSMALPRPTGRVEAKGLTVFPAGAKQPILRDVSFVLQPGEVLGVIGPTGAGKSTLVRALVGVVSPTAGGIYLDGHSTHTWERESFGRHVGYLPQGVALLDGSIRENISRMSDTDPSLVVEAARAAGIHDVIGALPNGYGTRIGPTGFNLSGGQVQRIGLARALFDSPAVLILDEPNSNLDNDGEIALDRAIRRAKAAGTTVIVVAHRPATVAQADKLLVLMNGRVDQFGDKAEVLQAGKAQAIGIRGVPAIRSAPEPEDEAELTDHPSDAPVATPDKQGAD
jgi:ATP-binding cassette subfamily C protein